MVVRWRCFAVLLLALLAGGAVWAAGGAGVPQRIVVGEAMTAADAPKRIVSLVPALTEVVCALDACERLVGTDRHSNWPPRVQALPKLGGLDDAQVERIVALRPDLVLVAPSARVAPRLEALGLRVLVLQADLYADLRPTLVATAAALGDAAAGERLWQRLEAQVDAAAARVPAGMRGQRVYFEVSPAPHAAGSASFIGELLARLGLGNVVPASLGPFPQLNPEFVLRAQPDVVMASAAALAEMPRRPGWATLDALEAQRTCGFTPAQLDVIVRPGPRLGDAAGLLADCVAAVAREAR
jgi:iron complex transport system substrate-binding protein